MKEGKPLEEILSIQQRFMDKVGLSRSNTGSSKPEDPNLMAAAEIDRLREQYAQEMEHLRQE